MLRNRKEIFIGALLIIITAIFTIILAKIPTAFKKSTLENPLISSSDYSINTPPSESLKGIITQLSGEVSWTSRSATEESTLLKNTEIVQGDMIHTAESGNLTVTFQNVATISALPKTHLGFTQTLPQNLVIQQDSGDVVYSRVSKTPISVRCNEILINLNSGKMEITVNSTYNRIYVDVLQGDGTVAFNDRNIVSQVIQVQNGHELIFDEDTRSADVIPY